MRRGQRVFWMKNPLLEGKVSWLYDGKRTAVECKDERLVKEMGEKYDLGYSKKIIVVPTHELVVITRRKKGTSP